MKKVTCSLVVLLSIARVMAQSYNIQESAIRNHIQYLASDKLEGREPGTKGEKLAIKYITKQFESLHLTPAGEKGYYQTFSYHVKKSPHDTVYSGDEKRGTNVMALLNNGREKTVVIGGHFDHLGKRGHTSSLDKDRNQIHNGADDNASGTAGVLELARYFSSNGIAEDCNLLFMCFSGEEDGLIGSKYFTNHPTLSLLNIKCMINMDMIGRLNDSTQKLMVYGVGTSPAFTNIFHQRDGQFALVFDSSGIGPSDQTSFYLKQIPVLHFFTGQHHDYHKASDDADKINYAGEVRVLNYIAQLTEAIMKEPQMPYSATRNQEQTKVSFKVTLGIMPDYTYEGEGVKIDAATEGKPAQKAGMIAGDIILQLGEIKTNSMQTYMKALSSFKKGESTEAIILRNKETLKLTVTF